MCDRRCEGGTEKGRAGEGRGEASKREAKWAGAYVAYGGRREANCALMMAACEINQTQPCPFSLWPTDKGLIWGRVVGVRGREES